MGTHAGSVMTLANSIIGVSVLAMPFCFKQCGIVLSILMLMLSSIVSRLACHYLIKSAIMEKRRNFEMLAFRAFGPTGKLMVELCIIGFMLGTCVAFFVVVGDLGPAIMAPILGFEHPTALRPSVLVALGIFVVLPLGLLRNVDSLTTLSAASIAFYLCLVLKVVGEATSHLLAWDWTDKVYYWRPSGVLQCIPIFSMALSCQTQLFEIFDSLPNTPLDRMNAVVRSAINMTTSFYIAVGFFGYVAFCNQSFSGNLMMSFSPTLTSDVIKLGFVLSVAVSFPLVIFPCRASIYSLLFSKGHMQQHELSGSAHIPETKFHCITLVIVTCSLVTGLLIPNIEVVLGLVGSTIGVFVCLIFPAVIFVSLSTRNTNERLLAKVLVGTGLVIMVLGTYHNLYATNEYDSQPEVKKTLEKPITLDIPIPKEKVVIRDETLKELKDVKELAALPELQNDKLPASVVKEKPEEVRVVKQSLPLIKARKEPPVPVEPDSKNGAPRAVNLQLKKAEVPDKEKELEEKKVDLVEQLKKHEEEHKKLINEGNQLLQEIKKSESKEVVGKEGDSKLIDVNARQANNNKKLEPVKAPIEVIVRANIDSGKKEVNIPPIKKEEIPAKVIDSAKETKEEIKKVVNEAFKQKMQENMAKGIPLPVAIKGDLGVKEELLKIEERGKRDLQEVEKLDRQEAVVTETPKEEVKPTEATEDKNKTFTNTLAKKEVKMGQDENCAKEMRNSNKTQVESPESGTHTHDDNSELIKTPSYLSEPKVLLEENPQKVSEGNSLGLMSDAGRPLKRDLKSVQPDNLETRSKKK